MTRDDLAHVILESPEFRRLFERISSDLRGKTSSDDLLQDLFLAIDSKEDLPCDEALRPWAMTIATRLLGRRRRSARGEQRALETRGRRAPRTAPTVFFDVPVDSPEVASLCGEFLFEVTRAMNRLPDGYGVAFWRVRLLNMPIEQVAAYMHRTPESVKALVKRAGRLIRAQLIQRGWGGVT